MINMRDQYITLASGKNWLLQRNIIQGQESVSFSFYRDTVLDAEVMAAIRQHGAWHLYSTNRWSGADLSVFKPVADIVKKLSLPAEKTTKIVGLNCFVNLESLSASGDFSEVDFARLTKLKSLNVNENSKGGNWHLCESLDHLMISVSMANLKKLKALKNLRSLSSTRALKSFDGIADLPNLRELRVGACHLPSVESLGRLPNLRLLLLNLMPKLESLKGIEGLPNLEELEVTQCGGLRDVSAIAALKQLKKLTLLHCPHLKSLDGVKLPPDCKVEFEAKGKVGDGF
jgi:hypothetical protein